MATTTTLGSRRRIALATPAEMRSSRRSLSISAFLGFSWAEFDGLRQQALQRNKIHGIVFRQRLINFVRKRLCVVDGCLHLGYRPAKMFGCRCQVILIGADQKHDLPNSKAAALDAGLAPGGGIAEIDEGEFR